jgi:hypothetical protein
MSKDSMHIQRLKKDRKKDIPKTKEESRGMGFGSNKWHWILLDPGLTFEINVHRLLNIRHQALLLITDS